MMKNIKFLFPTKNSIYSLDLKIKLTYPNPNDYIWVKKFCETVLSRKDSQMIIRSFNGKNIEFLTSYHEIIQELLQEKQFIEKFNEMYKMYIESIMIIKKSIGICPIDSSSIKSFRDYDYYLCFISYFLSTEDNFIISEIYNKFDSISFNSSTPLENKFRLSLRNSLEKMLFEEYRKLLCSIDQKRNAFLLDDYNSIYYNRLLRVDEIEKSKHNLGLYKNYL